LNSGTVNPVTDQQIRVLTPSEIMRTLPSLGQETYDLPSAALTVSQPKQICFYFMNGQNLLLFRLFLCFHVCELSTIHFPILVIHIVFVHFGLHTYFL
jgi:hypothetical protein